MLGVCEAKPGCPIGKPDRYAKTGFEMPRFSLFGGGRRSAATAMREDDASKKIWESAVRLKAPGC